MHTPSKQKWLETNRPPRVQISYDVETSGAIEKKELPLVVGILADLAGTAAVAPLDERRFVEIDRDSFDQVMAKIGPELDVARLTKVGAVPAGVTLSGTIRFSKLEHFEPEYIVSQVKDLKDLFDIRCDLRDLMAKLDGNAKLEGHLDGLFKYGDDGKLDEQANLETMAKLTGKNDPKPGAQQQQEGGEGKTQ